MNEREALKLALEALDCICSPLHVREITKVGNAMKAIKEALAQSDQEPDDLTIAYMSGFHDGKNKYAPQRKPLTDEQLIAAYESEQQGRYGDHIRALRAIETAHGIKE
jgi:regulator of replication initiation timing